VHGDEESNAAAAAEQEALRAMWCAAPYSQQGAASTTETTATAAMTSLIDHAAQVCVCGGGGGLDLQLTLCQYLGKCDLKGSKHYSRVMDVNSFCTIVTKTRIVHAVFTVHIRYIVCN